MKFYNYIEQNILKSGNITKEEIRCYIQEAATIGWFLLASQLENNLLIFICVIQGVISLIAGIGYAIKDEKNLEIINKLKQ